MYLSKECKFNMIRLVIDNMNRNIDIVQQASEAFGETSRSHKRNQINGIKIMAQDLVLELSSLEVNEIQ